MNKNVNKLNAEAGFGFKQQSSCNGRPSWEKISKRLQNNTTNGWNNQKVNVRTQKGMGPNKASGHKGGISRQGSKRG